MRERERMRRPKVGDKLNLENYDDFLKNPSLASEFLTVNHLNKIIKMHGFIKLHQRSRNLILEELGKMKLQNLQRSTLNEEIVPCGSQPTVEGVNHDLDAIGWLEYPVQHVEDLHLAAEDDSSINCCELAMDFGATVKKPRSKRRKKANYRVDGGDFADFSDACEEMDSVHHDVDTLLEQLTSGPWA